MKLNTNRRSINLQNFLPDDIVLRIASSLQVLDVCSLGSCSRFWRDLCGSDSVWEALCKDRWHAHGFSLDQNQQDSKGWRGLYISKHVEMAGKAASVASFIERALACESIEAGNYLKAIETLNSLQLGFKDVQMFLLKPDLNVLLNLVGLHYCVAWLGVSAEYIIEALHSSQVAERQVCVQWWKLGRWFHGYRLKDEYHSRNASLGDLTSCKKEVLGVLHRGAIHEVIRVQISVAKPTHTSWSHQVAQL